MEPLRIPTLKRFIEHGIGRYFYGFIFFAIVALVTGRCTQYHEQPLDQTTVDQSLTAPGMDAIRIEAKAIKHPILKPLSIDDRDGVSPEEAALIAVLINPKLSALRDKKGVAAAQLFQAGILPNPQLSYSLEFPTGGTHWARSVLMGLDWAMTSNRLSAGDPLWTRQRAMPTPWTWMSHGRSGRWHRRQGSTYTDWFY